MLADLIDALHKAAHEAQQFRDLPGDPTSVIEAIDAELVALIMGVAQIEDEAFVRDALAEFYGDD